MTPDKLEEASIALKAYARALADSTDRLERGIKELLSPMLSLLQGLSDIGLSSSDPIVQQRILALLQKSGVTTLTESKGLLGALNAFREAHQKQSQLYSEVLNSLVPEAIAQVDATLRINVGQLEQEMAELREKLDEGDSWKRGE